MLQLSVGALAARLVFGEVSGALERIGVPFAVRIGVCAILVLSTVVLCLWIFQESLLYQPSRTTPADNEPGARSPADQGLPYQEVKLTTSDSVTLHAWFIPSPKAQSSAPTVLFAHENAGNMGLRVPEFRLLWESISCNILLFDYRGYGESDRSTDINEAGLMRDAHAAWRWLLQQPIDTSQIVLYGRSLGGAVAIQLASQLCDVADGPLPAALIVGNTFTSIPDLLDSVYPWLAWPVVKDRLLRLAWKSIEHIAQVQVPIMFIVSSHDEIVPASHTQRLLEASILAPRIVHHVVEKGGHNDMWIKAGPDYLQWMHEFISAACVAQ